MIRSNGAVLNCVHQTLHDPSSIATPTENSSDGSIVPYSESTVPRKDNNWRTLVINANSIANKKAELADIAEYCDPTISNTRATFAYYSFCDNLRLQCTSQTIVMVCCRFYTILNYFLLRKSDVIKITRTHSMAMMIVMVSTDLVKLINSDKLCYLLK